MSMDVFVQYASRIVDSSNLHLECHTATPSILDFVCYLPWCNLVHLAATSAACYTTARTRERWLGRGIWENTYCQFEGTCFFLCGQQKWNAANTTGVDSTWQMPSMFWNWNVCGNWKKRSCCWDTKDTNPCQQEGCLLRTVAWYTSGCQTTVKLVSKRVWALWWVCLPECSWL